MKFQIDQSGRVEYTSHDTVLALSDDKHYTVLIPKKIKRQLQAEFRKRGQIRLFVYRTFAAGIVLLIKGHIKERDTIIIDTEYPGKGELIRDIMREMLQVSRLKEPQIYFRQIGKKSAAHRLAHRVFQKKQSADKVISLREIKELALDIKQKDSRV